jgi:hypothetical protein
VKKPKNTDPPLHHPLFGECVNVTALDATGIRQRLSESGHVVVDVRLLNGETRTLLASSFPVPAPPVVEQAVAA